MTNKNRKRRGTAGPPPARAAAGSAPPEAPPRPGLMASMFSARGTGTSNMPRVRTTFARGVVVVISSPVLLVGTVLGVFVVWLAAIAIGFQGPASTMSSALAMPPIGTYFDLQLTARVFGVGDTGTLLVGLIPLAIVRAVLVGVIMGLAVEILETERPTIDGARRGLLVAPMVLIVSVIEIGFLFVGNLLGQLVGQGLSLFVGVAAFALALYLLGYAPFVQLREGRGVLESLSRSTAGARIPGTSALAMAILYSLPSLFLSTPVGGLGVNPSPLVWVFVLVVNILHVSVIATYAYRWMCIEDEVPEPVARTRSRRR